MQMLSTDYSQLFSSGIRMLANRGFRPRRASQPPPAPAPAPTYGVSYISFEPDTPLSPAPSAPLLWRTALRRMSLPGVRPRRARRTTMPADFVLRPDAAYAWGAKPKRESALPVFREEDEGSSSSRSSSSSSSSSTDVLDEKPAAAAVQAIASPQPPAHASDCEPPPLHPPQQTPRRRPTPLLIITTCSPPFETGTTSTNTNTNTNTNVRTNGSAHLSSPENFLSLSPSAVSTEFPSPRATLTGARPRTMSVALAMHPYGRAHVDAHPFASGAEIDAASPSPRSPALPDWRRFHDDAEWLEHA